MRAFRNLYGALAPAGVLLIFDFQRDRLACRLLLTQGMVESIRASYIPQEVKWMLTEANIPLKKILSHFPYLSIEIDRQDELFSSQDPDTIKRLDELERGQEGRIVWIKMNRPERLQELLAMGISPDEVVRMIANYAHYVIFRVDHREFAAENEIASAIYVQTV